MKLFFRIIFKICLILAILIGCENNDEIKETVSNEPFNQGLALLKNRQYDRAIAYFNEALEINPRNADAQHRRGLAYYRKGYWDKAISDYTMAIEINPKFATSFATFLAYLYNKRGMAYDDKGQHNNALSDYINAIEWNPRFAKAYNNRGRAYEVKNQYDKACSDWRRACELGSCGQYRLAKRSGYCR